MASLGDDANYRRVDNVTDAILSDYRKTFGATVTKDDIFYYVYALLQCPSYVTQYESDLQKMLPRIPKVREFHAFSLAGRRLSKLHLDYESIKPYPLQETRRVGASYRVEKMRYGKRGREIDKSVVLYNNEISLSEIPAEAHEYRLGSRSAIDWILERYQVKTDKASGIINDPNDWVDEKSNPRYILDLLGRVVAVSVETVQILRSLPAIEIVS